MLEAQAMRDAQTSAPGPNAQPVQFDDSQPAPAQDPKAADRKRREYESLFASNVVLSRRPENERPDVGRSTSQGLGNLDRYRIPTTPITAHDPSRSDFGRPWIQGLNSGDASGAAYLATTLPLLRPTALPAKGASRTHAH